MTHNESTLAAVPTNIITGFLGVGKTSAILHLLKAKPENERWAVLVNEFGEVGVDGSLFAGNYPEEKGVYIKEVPGGCMCCAAGLPMQIALNQLLVRSKPDRLLIEPTGLGHPREVMEVLSSSAYSKILSIQKTVTLVDARKLVDERYTTHDTFNQQIAIADVVVGNKLDLYQEVDKECLRDYVKKEGRAETVVEFVEQGRINANLLAGEASFSLEKAHHHHHDKKESMPLSDMEIPESGYIRADNSGEGYQSVGWRISADKIFDRKKLFTLLSGLVVERMKAVFVTDEGIFGYNLTMDALTEIEIDDCLESRIEIIDLSLDSNFESSLFECLI